MRLVRQARGLGVVEHDELGAQLLQVVARLQFRLIVLGIYPRLNRGLGAQVHRHLLRERTRWPEAEPVSNLALHGRHRLKDAEMGDVHLGHADTPVDRGVSDARSWALMALNRPW